MEEKGSIEVRGFLQLNSRLKKKFGTMPVIYELDAEITGEELAEKLDIDIEEVEVIFVNGFVESVDFAIKPGDRVAFLPPGCPGPYRIALGFYDKNQNNPANFKIKGR
ncbi:MAG: MoaD/ThiS family protein [Tissierellaceae bacterium]|nr:MoaD/ThiS family protein [Tissierellaceae bacterium]